MVDIEDDEEDRDMVGGPMKTIVIDTNEDNWETQQEVMGRATQNQLMINHNIKCYNCK